MHPELIDIGLNLTHDSFDSDRDVVIERADAVGVKHLLITGSCLSSNQAAIDLVRRYPQRMRATAGVHPHHAGEFSSSECEALRQQLMQPEVVATGECGLDYFRNLSPKDEQLRVFRLLLELGVESQPLFLHQRDAHDDFVGLLQEFLPQTAGGVAHCFTAGPEQAREYLDMGLYIGITGWLCDERRGQHLREVVRYLPLDRMLIETDAPYLLPRDLSPQPKSRRNEPMYLAHVLSVIAECRGESVELIAEATTGNASRLFGWPVLATGFLRRMIIEPSDFCKT
jgi:TatD DNase family protein